MLVVLAAFIGTTFTKKQWSLGWSSDFPEDSNLVLTTCWLLQNPLISCRAACKSTEPISVCNQKYTAQSSDYKTQSQDILVFKLLLVSC